MRGAKRVGEMQVQRKKEGRKGFLLSICSSSKGSSLLDYRFSVALELLCRKLHQALCSALAQQAQAGATHKLGQLHFWSFQTSKFCFKIVRYSRSGIRPRSLNSFKTSSLLDYKFSVALELNFCAEAFNLEKILKGSLNLIPSPS